MPVDRLYAARRIESGLYIQPANDGQRYFVIVRYEDGRAHGLDHGPEHFTAWAWGAIPETDRARIERTSLLADPEDLLYELRMFGMENTGYPTKRQAVDAALASTKARSS